MSYAAIPNNGGRLMPTMNVNLTNELEKFVKSETEAGEYSTASEVVRDALRLLRRERDVAREKQEILKREVKIGLVQARSGKLSERSVRDISRAVRKVRSGA
jgi:antitoxin ParD1/3/4